MTANDLFWNHSTGLEGPAENGANVAPNDGNDLVQVTRALYVGGGGDIRITTRAGTQITLTNVPAGALLPLRICRIWQTDTTATDLVALW